MDLEKPDWLKQIDIEIAEEKWHEQRAAEAAATHKEFDPLRELVCGLEKYKEETARAYQQAEKSQTALAPTATEEQIEEAAARVASAKFEADQAAASHIRALCEANVADHRVAKANEEFAKRRRCEDGHWPLCENVKM